MLSAYLFDLNLDTWYLVCICKMFIENFNLHLRYNKISPTSIDDQANHMNRKSNFIFGDAFTIGLFNKNDVSDIMSKIWK